MLYLLDANILMTADRDYYPISQVPEFWGWIKHQARSGNVKIPKEIMQEILVGRKNNDPLLDWIKEPETQKVLTLAEDVQIELVQNVISIWI